MTITLADIEAAAGRIEDKIRRTPILDAGPNMRALAADGRVTLKLECLQVTGSFKPRGALNKATRLPPEDLSRGIVTASGGNHGLGVAYAAWSLGVPAEIYLPHPTPQAKADKLRRWGATVVMAGEAWDDANEAALARARERGLAYIHPFADPDVIAGQGTLALEILEQVPDVDTLVVAIGGGGLISGVATAARERRPGIRIIGVEPVGAPTLFESLRAKRVVTLDRVETEAGTLAPRRSTAVNLDIIGRTVDRIVLVSDDEMRDAARWLWFETGVAAELSGAAALAAIVTGRYAPKAGETVVPIICGAGTDGMA